MCRKVTAAESITAHCIFNTLWIRLRDLVRAGAVLRSKEVRVWLRRRIKTQKGVAERGYIECECVHTCPGYITGSIILIFCIPLILTRLRILLRTSFDVGNMSILWILVHMFVMFELGEEINHFAWKDGRWWFFLRWIRESTPNLCVPIWLITVGKCDSTGGKCIFTSEYKSML